MTSVQGEETNKQKGQSPEVAGLETHTQHNIDFWVPIAAFDPHS